MIVSITFLQHSIIMKLKRWLLVIGVPVLFALAMRIGFGIETFRDFVKVMSITFFFCLPVGVGVLTMVFSDIEKVKKRSYRGLMPWVPIMVFFVLTLALFIEGWACWVMALPVFMVLSSVGGEIGGYFKLRNKKKSDRLNVSLALLLPVVMMPIEDAVKLTPANYQAYTYIDIQASPQTIWNHVLRVREISTQEDKGTLTNFLGFPRPLKAELNYAGVGGSRQAIFTRGLVFKEVVTKYSHEKEMQFTINANSYEIPSATLDKHLLIGGDYFNVLDGTYVLQALNNNTCRLHLYSHFTVNTSFNFYAGIWTTWIMKDIQNNILQVVQHRCEEGR